MPTIKIIIAGTRTFNDMMLVENTLIDLLRSDKFGEDRPIEIVSGGAQGADTLGELFAKKFRLKLTKFAADWRQYGKSAGPIRNFQMARYADILVCFWDGSSRGSKNMIEQMQQQGKPTHIYNIKETSHEHRTESH